MLCKLLFLQKISYQFIPQKIAHNLYHQKLETISILFSLE